MENRKEMINAFLEESGVVGAAVCLIDQGKSDFFVYGKKAIQESEPVSEETLFEIGGINKLFTAFALMETVAHKVVKLQDSVESCLPKVKVPHFNGSKMQLRHLATHTSGLPRLPDNFYSRNANNPYADYSLDYLYDFLNRTSLTKEPGAHLAYSSLGMGLLGHLLSLKWGKSYEAVIVDLIADSLGMRDTYVYSAASRLPQFATGHYQGKSVERWTMAGLPLEGAFSSHIRDMGAFLAANMGLVAPAAALLLKECHKKQYKTPNMAVGLGWMLSSKTELLTQSGNTGGFTSFIGLNPKIEKGVVILSNTREPLIDDLGKLLIDPDFKRPFINKELASDPDYLKKFSGNYRLVVPEGTPAKELHITPLNKALSLALSGEALSILYPQRFATFSLNGSQEMRVQFSFDYQGKVSKIEAFLSNETLLWEALPKI